jgi:hypothetical protein
MSQPLKNVLEICKSLNFDTFKPKLDESVLIIIANILNSASSLKLVPIKSLMDQRFNIFDKTKRFELIEAFFQRLILN